MLYVIVAGSRSFNDYSLMTVKMNRLLENYPNSEIVIISGGARGADRLAERYAREYNIALKIFPADWDKFGKSAGYRRNEQMHSYISQFPNRGCVCFWDGSSKGTQHNFKLAERFHTPLRIVRY